MALDIPDWVEMDTITSSKEGRWRRKKVELDSEGEHLCKIPNAYEEKILEGSVWQCLTCKQKWELAMYWNLPNTKNLAYVEKGYIPISGQVKDEGQSIWIPIPKWKFWK